MQNFSRYGFSLNISSISHVAYVSDFNLLFFFLNGDRYSLFLRALNTSQLKALSIDMLPGYRDPYSSRPLTRGEIGCFLSHYYIWKEVRSLWVPRGSCRKVLWAGAMGSHAASRRAEYQIQCRFPEM